MTPPLQLDESLLFGEGATRKCYYHPNNPDICLKIEKDGKSVNEHDLTSYYAAKDLLSPFIAEYSDELVDTNLGKALACELVRDHDGKLSQSFSEFRRAREIPPRLAKQFLAFFDLLKKNELFFYDFNPKNFLIQQAENGSRLKYTDLKSLGKTKTALALEKIPCFARKKLKRRTHRFIKRFLSPKPTH